MKMIRLMAIAAILAATGCSKKDNTDNSLTNNDNKRLRSFKTEGASDSSSYNFNYDSQNRVSTVHTFLYEGATLIHERTYTYNYNGNDSLPSSVIMDYSNNSGSTGLVKEFFSYDASGKVVKDSISDGSGGLGYHFSYLPGYFTVHTSFNYNVKCIQTLSNGNIVAETDTITNQYLDVTYSNFQLGFDNHPNPFYYAGIRRILLYMPENYLQDIEEFTPVFKNNPLNNSWHSTGSGYTFNETYSYTYDTDGYPVTVTATDLAGNGMSYTGYYYY